MNNDEFCARSILDQDQGNDFRVLDYGCWIRENSRTIEEEEREAFGCELFYEGGSYSKSVPPQLWGALSVRGRTGCWFRWKLDALTVALDRSSNARCRSQGSIYRSGDRATGKVFDGKHRWDVGKALRGGA